MGRHFTGEWQGHRGPGGDLEGEITANPRCRSVMRGLRGIKGH